MRVSGIVASALISVALAAPGTGCAGADVDEFGLGAAPSLAPGVAIGTYNIDTTPGAVCTVGWLVTDDLGRPGLLTAASCFHGGTAVFASDQRGYQGVGRFTDHDDTLAVLGVNNAEIPSGPVRTDTRIAGIRPVAAAPADPARPAVGQQLCAYGTVSRLRCGPITALTETTVTVAVPSAPADTGGPVYYRGSQAAVPVGVTVSGDRDSTTAAILGPWLHRWQLAVDTTDAAAARRVDVHTVITALQIYGNTASCKSGLSGRLIDRLLPR